MLRTLYERLTIVMLGCAVASCAITRTETDLYTITLRDTTYRETVRNVPGSSEDNGVVFPSSRVTQISRNTMTRDSTHERTYPNFMRIGGVEFAGLMLTSGKTGVGPGLLGVYSILDSNTINGVGNVFNPKADTGAREGNVFKGSFLRVVPYEYRLRWFDDAPDWTIGGSVVEIWNKDEDEGLSSVLANVYLRKRYYIRDKIPYIIAAPYFGISFAPSMYGNLGGELILGSFGGFNLRGYAGLISGFTWNFTERDEPSKSVTFPYVGIGISALDFLNKPVETEREWKEYTHSAIEVTVLQLDLLGAFAGYPNAFDTTVGRIPFTGGSFKFATSHFPLPFADGKFWAGTSLFNYFALGFSQSTFSVLPLRFGYRQHLIAEDLSVEPFLELNYYPSQYLNVGAKLRLNTFSGYNFGVLLGFATGSSGAFLPNAFFQEGSPIGSSFSSAYAGIAIGLNSTIYTPEFVNASVANQP